MADTQTATTSGGIGCIGLLGVLFVVLKVIGAISWSWWWVTLPFWGLAAVSVLIAIIIILAAIFD